MFRWWTATPKKTKKTLSVRQRRITLHLEALEARDCPSASLLDAPLVADPSPSLSPSVTTAPEGTATASGTSPTGGTTATLSGVVSGSVTTNVAGAFTATGPAQSQPTVTEYAGNAVSPPPTIVNFRAVNNGNNNWTFTGQLQCPNAAGLVVTLAGIPSLDANHTSATVQANGSFSYTVTLRRGECGAVTAETVDRLGQTSNEPIVYVPG